jgi:hypothetical protein
MAIINSSTVSVNLKFNPANGLNMQTIYQAILDAAPKDKTIIGVGIPLLGIECKHYGVINPIEEIKEAAYQLNRRTEFSVLSKDFKP